MNGINPLSLESLKDIFSLGFPLHFIFNENMQFVQFGPSFVKVCSAKLGDPVTKFFNLKNMDAPFSFELMKNSKGSVFLLQIINSDTLLKGSVYFDKKSNAIVFLCSIAVKTYDELIAAGLLLTDFLPHDSIYDLIFSQQSFSSAIREARQLVLNTKEHTKIKKLFNNQKIISKKLFDLYENSPDLLLSTNFISDEIIQCNRTVLNVLGYAKDELINKLIFDLITPDFVENAYKFFKKFKKFKKFNATDLEVKKKNGSVIYTSCLLSVNKDVYGKIFSINISLRDITKEKELFVKTTRLANYDSLTGLPNRRCFQDFFQKTVSLAHNKKSKKIVGVLLVDINDFKSINDYHGHHVGDQVLIEAGIFLKKQLQQESFLARYGGDEFVIVVEGKKNTLALVKRIIDNVKNYPLLIHYGKINLQFCIGISFYPEGGITENQLLKGADIALIHAKKTHDYPFFYFNELLNREHMALLEIENNLLCAIEKQEFSLVYHPQINIQDLKIVGLEVLVRWQSKKLGQVPPSVFIPIAERRGLMRTIDEWVFDNACRQLLHWNNIGITNIHLSINISGTVLDDSSLPNKLLLLCKKNSVCANQIELEITETAIMNLKKESLAIIHKLDKVGFNLAIDDFGVEHSSLRRLCELPIKTLKIDKFFVKSLSVKSGAVLLSIIELAANLGLKIIAEGVETQEELDFILKTRCQNVQGYYFHKPLEVDMMTALLISNV